VDELRDIRKSHAFDLDEESLLHLAAATEDAEEKESILKEAVNNYQSDRAQYNLAVLYLRQGKNDKAEEALAAVKDGGPEVINAMGVLALRKGDYETAADCFKKAGTAEAKANLGVVCILTGKYNDAVGYLKDAPGCPVNKALAYILVDELDNAESVLQCGSDKANYLRAIIAARKGDADKVAEFLHKVKDSELQARAKKDVEFAGFDW